MHHVRHSCVSRNLVRQALCFALAAAAMTGTVTAYAESGQATFASTDEAVTALINAIRADGTKAIVDVLGPDGAELTDSGDPVADASRRSRFIAAFEEAHVLQNETPDKTILAVGRDEFPFPVPLVQENGKWRWNSAAGLDEALTRRIGENELATIEVMRAYVAAQIEYAARERDGRGIQYARRLMSREGRKDGLYWPASEGEEPSPIGPLIAEAQREGYNRQSSAEGQPAYHGYVYRMLYGQGRNSNGGARDYIVNDRMIGGYALIATPADYGNSGVMTFIVNQDGLVFQKDLGPDTGRLAQGIKLFDPGADWHKVEAK